MPFGLQGATATFQMLMVKVLKCISWKYVLCYVDDVLIYSSTFEEHLEHLSEVFKRIRQAGLKLSPKKCFFAQKKIIYLGYVLSKDGIQTDVKKIENNQNLVAPKDRKGIKSLLRLTYYSQNIVAGFNKICAPIYELLKKD
jgi:hypothetical protein